MPDFQHCSSNSLLHSYSLPHYFAPFIPSIIYILYFSPVVTRTILHHSPFFCFILITTLCGRLVWETNPRSPSRLLCPSRNLNLSLPNPTPSTFMFMKFTFSRNVSGCYTFQMDGVLFQVYSAHTCNFLDDFYHMQRYRTVISVLGSIKLYICITISVASLPCNMSREDKS